MINISANVFEVDIIGSLSIQGTRACMYHMPLVTWQDWLIMRPFVGRGDALYDTFTGGGSYEGLWHGPCVSHGDGDPAKHVMGYIQHQDRLPALTDQ